MGSEQSSFSSDPSVKRNQVNFTINRVEYMVRTDYDGVTPNTMLVDFIRDKAGLKGTKFTCREGGCGACVVTVKTKDKTTKTEIVRGVNSCLTPVLSCDGWEIYTVEFLGNHKNGYHKIQNRLVSFGGTQCGFCTPGMVMNMFSLTETNKKLDMVDIEDAFDGNICRCTGYRPILDAFKSLASDATPDLQSLSIKSDEETKGKCSGCPCSPEAQKACGKSSSKSLEESKLHLTLPAGEEWVKPDSLDTLFEVIQKFKAAGMQFRYVAGNTGQGVYRDIARSANYIDVNAVPELKTTVLTNSKFVLGGGVTLSMAIDSFLKSGSLDEYKSYGEKVAKHIKRVANTPVRNAGTLAGNLMLKHVHKEFPSDIFVILETLNAKLSIASAPNLRQDVSPAEFLQLDMNGKIILSIEFPQLKTSEGWVFQSYKISKRYQNAHAYVNAGFLFKVDAQNAYKIVEKPRIVYGGINPTFVHAQGTETLLVGKNLKDQGTISGAIDSIEKELQPDAVLPDASVEYRRNLGMSLFYKTALSILKNDLGTKLKSGGEEIVRKPVTGKQDFETDKSQWPVNQPIHKLESYAQVSGEAEYTNDIHPQQGELYGALLISTVANADLESIDPSEALQVPGIVQFIQAKHIPGKNSYMGDPLQPNQYDEIFVSKKVGHSGACLGMLIGENREVALKALEKIKVKYTNVQKPILDIKSSLTANGNEAQMTIESNEVSDAPNRIKGEFKMGGQYHFTMETHSCLVVPKEDGNYDVFAATQGIDHCQTAIADALNIPHHNLNVSVKRLGGGYGCKISRASQVFAACALGAYNTGKPVRVVLDLDTNMEMVGKRLPYLTTYDIGFDNSGKILDAKITLICDPGFQATEVSSGYATYFIQNCYNPSGWKVKDGVAITNTHGNTWCRAPGSTEAIATIENIIEHISRVVKKDPLEVRAANYIKPGDPSYYIMPDVKYEGENPIPKMIEQLKQSGDYAKRRAEINQFNLENRWKKRGMSMVPMRYAVHYGMWSYPVYLTVYHQDGTVAISHSGIEMGQGLNTKVVQVVAKTLGIPLEKIKVKPANNLTGANASVTGGAVTSELVSYSAIKACEILMAKMAPVKAKLKDASWERIVDECHKEGVEMAASYLLSKNDGVKSYDVYAVNLLEVELDVLTGENKVSRVDLIEDTGKSLSPEVDIGQIEGALIMGMGYWTIEKLIYDPQNGQLLTNNTWNYKVPLLRDIPEDFRITLLKNAPNPFGVLRSKATGEPPLCLGVTVLFALRDAIDSARKDAGISDEFYTMDGPCTPEEIVKLCMTNKSQLIIQ